MWKIRNSNNIYVKNTAQLFKIVHRRIQREGKGGSAPPPWKIETPLLRGTSYVFLIKWIHKLIPVNQLYSTDEEGKALETIVSL